jgi:hypothetical protein
MNATLSALVRRLGDELLADMSVIPWSCPVPSFGDIARAKVATIGLNPSNREFVDRFGKELDGTARRFETLTSLGLDHWSDASPDHVDRIWEACRNYFSRNPYDIWFRQLDDLIAGTNASYYGEFEHACHLDLIPYATACKWTDLSIPKRSALLRLAGDTLGILLRESSVRLLILNGQGVVVNFQRAAGIELQSVAMCDWALRRDSKPCVSGIAYKGTVSELMGMKLDRELLVLGFNHNIQSSFGVTREVRTSIGRWIGRSHAEMHL